MLKYTKEFYLRVSDFDTYDHLFPSAILDLFQDVAGKHADDIGIGFDTMISKNLVWMIVRSKYEIYQQPKLYQTVKVITWPHVKGRVDMDRDYLIEDLDGNILVKGTSKWVVVNYISRRLVRPRDIEYPSDEYCQAINFEEHFDKLEDFDIDGVEPFVQYPSFCDLDHNGHVNNTKYANFIVNGLNLKKDESIVKFQIDYIHELEKNTKINLYYLKNGNEIKVKGIDKDGQTSFIASLIVEKK